MNRRASRAGVGRVFAVPAALGIATVAGLVIGLTGDGVADVIAWLLLAVPLGALLLAWARRERAGRTN